MRSALRFKLSQLRNVQRQNGYKVGWVWYQLQDEFYSFSLEELRFIAETLDYKPSWARHQWAKIYERRSRWQAEAWLHQAKVSSHLDRFLDLLGLQSPFKTEELKAAYRRKSKELHPDVGGSHDDFIRLNEAYQALQGYAIAGGAQ